MTTGVNYLPSATVCLAPKTRAGESPLDVYNRIVEDIEEEPFHLEKAKLTYNLKNWYVVNFRRVNCG